MPTCKYAHEFVDKLFWIKIRKCIRTCNKQMVTVTLRIKGCVHLYIDAVDLFLIKDKD